ncbi:MAG: SIR2 family protein [Planctomycetes bacterium]|nr:SIR2 family protein [Planctomycetota bacterium]
MSSLTQTRIAFLLGSGISIPAKMPSTQVITKQILSGEGVMRHADGNYYFDKPLYAHEGTPDEYVPRVVVFLNRLKIEIDLYYLYETGHFTNYEDLYYVASQIHDSESKEYDNPVVQPFINKVLSEIRPLLVREENEIRNEWQLLEELANEAAHYIRDVVWYLLSKEPNSLDHLNCIKDACLDYQLSNIDIFSLNHDTVLEQSLSQNDIQVIDGFGLPQKNVRYWNPDLFDSRDSKVRLFKLHGSVNWFRFRPDSGSWSDESIGIPLDLDFWHTKSPQGQRQWPVGGRPMLLVGTFNKMLQYTSDIYADLHYQLYRSLRHAQQLVVCGYSFGDKGINTRIIEWIYSSSNQKITVVHPEPEKLKRAARGAISKQWDEWIKQRKLTILTKTIEESSWQNIKDILF